MIFVAVLVVALVGGLAVLGVGGGVLARDRDGTAPALVLLAGVIGIVVLLAGGSLLLGAGGVDRGGEDDAPSPLGTVESTTVTSMTVTSAPVTTAPVRPTDAPPTTRPVHGSFPGLGGQIRVGATPRGALPLAVSVAGDLAGGDVVPVVATGFGYNIDGNVRQCATDGSERACTPVLPVRFDGRGVANFLFLLADEVASGDAALQCRGQVSCTLEVRDVSGREATALLEFGVAVSEAPELQVARTTVNAGEAVTVSVRGLAPRERVRIVQCAANEEGRSGCGEPGADVAVVADALGVASAELIVREGRVGANVSVECTRRTTCGIAVVHADGLVRAAPVEVGLAAGPTADYDRTRLLVGLLVALALATGAALLGVRTDWRGAPDPFA